MSQVSGAPTHVDIIDSQTSCHNLKTRGLGTRLWVAFYYFNFESSYDVFFKVKESMLFVEEKYKL